MPYGDVPNGHGVPNRYDGGPAKGDDRNTAPLDARYTSLQQSCHGHNSRETSSAALVDPCLYL